MQHWYNVPVKHICRAILLLIVLSIAGCAQPPLPTDVPSPFTSLTSLTPAPSATLRPYPSDTPSPTATLVSTAEPLPSATAEPTSAPVLYVVGEEDVMFDIALRYGITLDQLKAANPTVIPNAMGIGTVLVIPVTPTPAPSATPALPNLPATGTPLPAQQSLDADCYRDGAGGVYCFVPIANTGGEPFENVSALVTLTDSASGQVYQQSAVLPLNILPAGKTLPAVTYFMPPTPAEFSAAATLEFSLPVTNWHLRYADAAVVGPKTTISDDGNQAEVSGSIFFADKERPVSSVWVVGVAYTEDGRVAGLRRWEAVPPIRVSQNLPFRFLIFNAADAPIAEVELFVEARPVLP